MKDNINGDKSEAKVYNRHDGGRNVSIKARTHEPDSDTVGYCAVVISEREFFDMVVQSISRDGDLRESLLSAVIKSISNERVKEHLSSVFSNCIGGSFLLNNLN